MEKYAGYGLEEFLSDNDFRQWVLDGKPGGHPVWPLLAMYLPAESEVMEQAAELLLLWQQEAALDKQEITYETERILSVTYSKPFRRLSAGTWSAAAAVVVLLLAGWGIWSYSSGSAGPFDATYKKIAAADLREISNESDSPQTVFLPDSSEVRLSPQARIRYSAQLGTALAPDPGKREVYMTGTVFFAISKNKELPFLVYADGLLTRVLGTSFTIRSSGQSVSVEVKTGRVTVKRLDDSEEVVLAPNQKITYMSANRQLEKDLAYDPGILSEVPATPMFAFDNAPIAAVFEVLEKAYGIPIQFDPEVMEHCYLNVHLGTESFYEKMDIICRTIQAELVIAEGKAFVKTDGCS